MRVKGSGATRALMAMTRLMLTTTNFNRVIYPPADRVPVEGEGLGSYKGADGDD